MAPLPPNSTDRYFFHYVNDIHSHRFAVRTAPSFPLATLVTAVEAVLSAISAGFQASSGVSIDFQALGTNFSVPVASGSWAAFTWGSGAGTAEFDAIPADFQGRSSGGKKCRFGVFGWSAQVSDYRLAGVEDGNVSTAVGVLNGTAGAFLAIDGIQPVWYSYLNLKPNDYWVRKAR